MTYARRSTVRSLSWVAILLLTAQGATAGGVRLRPSPPRVITVATLAPPAAASTSPSGAPKKSSAPKGCYELPRATRDRPDLRDGRLVHVVYLLPSDATDERLDRRGVLDCSARAQNEWFEEASGGLRWRFDMFKAKVGSRTVEATDVTFVRSKLAGAELGGANAVAGELTRLGFAHPEKRYLSFVAAPAGPCGDALYPFSFTGEWADGQFAQVYLDSADACHADEFGVPGNPSWAEAIAQQELIHNDGLTSPGAPHGCLGGVPPGLAHVCTGPLFATEGSLNLDPERIDVMYPYVSVPLSEKVLDQGNDDYYRHPLPNLVDLEDSPYLEPAGGATP